MHRFGRRSVLLGGPLLPFAARADLALRGGEDQQITPVFGGADEFRRFFAEPRRVWGVVVEENGIKGES